MRDLPTLEWPLDIEALVGGDIGKAHRQRAHSGTHAPIKQVTGSKHAAEFVAVRQCVDQHMGAWLIGNESMYVINADVACAVRAQVARQDLNRG